MFGIFSRLKIGFGLARRSGRVLRTHPALLVFPLVGGTAGIAFMLTLFGGFYLVDLHYDPGLALYAALFVIYVVETFVASFFSAALVAATRTALRGGEPTITGGLSAAWERKVPLLAWSVVAAVVGVLIRAIESQDNIVARLLAGLFAVAWSVMTFFVVPVIVFEDPSVRGMFGQSASTFKNTWGESIGAMGAIDIVTFLLMLVGVALGVGTFLLLPASAGLFAGLAIALTGAVFGLLVGKSLSGIAKTALYVYATEQTAPDFFDDMDFSKLGGETAVS